MTRHPLLTTRQLLKFLACRPTSRKWQRKMSLKWTTQPCQSELIWIKQSCPSFCKDSRSWWKKGENVRLSHALLHLSIIKNDARWWSNILPCPTRPDNPVEYLAQYLIKNNPQTTNWIESRQHSINHIPCPCYTIALMNLCNINVITYPVHVLDEWCTGRVDCVLWELILRVYVYFCTLLVRKFLKKISKIQNFSKIVSKIFSVSKNSILDFFIQ